MTKVFYRHQACMMGTQLVQVHLNSSDLFIVFIEYSHKISKVRQCYAFMKFDSQMTYSSCAKPEVPADQAPRVYHTKHGPAEISFTLSFP